MKLTSEQTAVFEAGARWAKNILTELSGNYGWKLSTKKQAHLRLVLTNLEYLFSQETNSPGGEG